MLQMRELVCLLYRKGYDSESGPLATLIYSSPRFVVSLTFAPKLFLFRRKSFPEREREYSIMPPLRAQIPLLICFLLCF